MGSTTILLFLSSCSTAIIHALIPDHWLPFALMSRVEGWTLRRTLLLVSLTGVLHVAASIALASLIILIGVDGARRLAGRLGAPGGELGGWLLLVFGVVYGLLAHLREARAHHGGESSGRGGLPVHAHGHLLSRWSRGGVTGGALVAVIGISPCVLLQPILFTAAGRGLGTLAASAAGFATCTVLTMTGVVWAATRGLQRLPVGLFTHYGDLASGAVLAVLGLCLIVGDW